MAPIFGQESYPPQGRGTISESIGREVSGKCLVIGALANRSQELVSVESSDVESSPLLVTPQEHRRLMRLPRNPMAALFEKSHGRSTMRGELWMKRLLEDFDACGRKERRRLLEDFLSVVSGSGAATMEQLFAHQAHLLFARLASWLVVTLPIKYEIPLQLRALSCFLEFGDAFVASFFETGVVDALIYALTICCDATADVRIQIIDLLHRLATFGPFQKSSLCSRGLVDKLSETIASGCLRWPGTQAAGRLLYELFLDNCKYHATIVEELSSLLHPEAIISAQRISLQTLDAIIIPDPSSDVYQLFGDSERVASLAQQSLYLLQKNHLRTAADAFRFLTTLLRRSGCDKHLHNFAYSELLSDGAASQIWIKLAENCVLGTIRSCRHQRVATWMNELVKDALLVETMDCVTNAHPRIEDIDKDAVAAELDEAFCADAVLVLRWGLVLVLAKRDAAFCSELVKNGLTETILTHLLDGEKPTRQAVALVTLHRLRLLSRESQSICERVLNANMLRAVTLDQFHSAFGTGQEALGRALFKLRNLRHSDIGARHCAQEVHLTQSMIELQVKALWNEIDAAGTGVATKHYGLAHITNQAGEEDDTVDGGREKSVFLTAPSTNDDWRVPRSGNNRYMVHRVPLPKDAVVDDFSRTQTSFFSTSEFIPKARGTDYKLVMGAIEELPSMNSLMSHLVDLHEEANHSDGLEAEVAVVSKSSSGSGLGLRASWSQNSKSFGQGNSLFTNQHKFTSKEQTRKASHRLNIEHVRALALRPALHVSVQRLAEARAVTRALGEAIGQPPGQRMVPRAYSRADTESTELSLRIGDEDGSTYICEETTSPLRSLYESHSSLLGSSCCKHGNHHFSSLADTSVGLEEPSTDTDPLSAGPSWMTSSHILHEDPSSPSLGDIKETDEQMASTVSFLEYGKFTGAFEPRLVKRRILNVEAPPYHECIAFHRDHDVDAKSILDDRMCIFINSGTKDRMEAIRSAGLRPKPPKEPFSRQRRKSEDVTHLPPLPSARGRDPSSAREKPPPPPASLRECFPALAAPHGWSAR